MPEDTTSAQPSRRKRVNLRRKKATTLTHLSPGDVVRIEFDGGWFVVIETDNGVRIEHREAANADLPG